MSDLETKRLEKIELLATCILTDQVPAERIPSLIEENPGLREALERVRKSVLRNS